MYKRTVTYEDYDGNKRTEDFFFHMNKAEVIKWLMCNGGYTLDKQLEQLYKTSKGKDIMDIFEDLLRRSYGVKSLDGRRFDKTKEQWDDFRSTEAYSEIFTELVTDAKKAAAFINSIMPMSMAGEINQIMADNKDGIPEELRDYMTSEVLNEDGELVQSVQVEKKPAKVTPIQQTLTPML